MVALAKRPDYGGTQLYNQTAGSLNPSDVHQASNSINRQCTSKNKKSGETWNEKSLYTCDRQKQKISMGFAKNQSQLRDSGGEVSPCIGVAFQH
jgi:hypothetical protein